jgi:IS605 OrfB family transposase
MRKKHKRKLPGGLRRTSRIYLTTVNRGKQEQLRAFLLKYALVVRYFIVRFWSGKEFSEDLADKPTTDRGVKRFGITARLSQAAAKQAKEIVRSQKEKKKSRQRMPRFKNTVANLDSRFVSITEFKGHFDLALKFSSGLPNLLVPINHTRHSRKLLKAGYRLSHSIRLGIKSDRVFVDLIFEKQRPVLKETGRILGLDIGYRVVIATSRKELIGVELKDQIEQAGKRRKSFHHYIQTELNRLLKQIDLKEVQVVVLESLKGVKHGRRGKFSRQSNRLLSFWHYAKVIDRLVQHCEEEGVRVELKSPWKTSQGCPVCHNLDRRNRKAAKFKCVNCSFEEHADIVGALNLEALEVAGVYSLRSLTS